MERVELTLAIWAWNGPIVQAPSRVHLLHHPGVSAFSASFASHFMDHHHCKRFVPSFFFPSAGSIRSLIKRETNDLWPTTWSFTFKTAAASESRQVLGLVGSSVSLPCLFVTDSESLEADRTSLVASDRARSVTSNRLSTRPRLDLNHTFDSVRLVLFYKESIKSGPIYSIDSRFATQFTAARHFASPTFKSRLSVEGHPTSLLHMPDPSSDGIKATSDSSSPEPGIRLHIRSLGPADAGDYKCRVDFRRGRTLTTHVHLKVIGTHLLVSLKKRSTKILHVNQIQIYPIVFANERKAKSYGRACVH